MLATLIHYRSPLSRCPGKGFSWGTSRLTLRQHGLRFTLLAAALLSGLLLAVASDGQELQPVPLSNEMQPVPLESAAQNQSLSAPQLAPRPTADPLRPFASGTVDGRGDVVYRWNENGGEAYLLEGQVRLETPSGDLKAQQAAFLIRPVVSPSGARQWQVQLAATGRVDFASPQVRSQFQSVSQGSETVWKAQWNVWNQPTIDAPQFRGTPAQRPALLTVWTPATPPAAAVVTAGGRLPAAMPPAGTDVSQAQYQLSAPTLAPYQPAAQLSPPGLIEASPVPAELLPPVQAWQPPSDGRTAAPASPGQVVSPDVPMMPAQPQSTDNRFQFILNGGAQSVEIISRSSSMNAVLDSQDRIETGETVVVARGGVTVLIRDVQAMMPQGNLLDLGTVTLSADKVVGWVPLIRGLLSGASTPQDAEGEFYLEGNIVFRQGDRVIYADSMYYNVTRQYGMVLGAEAITTVPNFDGVVRLKAEVMQQVAKGEFIAFDAAVTSSRMGVPRYWLQSQQLRLSDQQRVAVDPITGLAEEVSDRVITSNNNFVYLGGVPVLYWPRFTSDVEVSSFYLNSVRVKRDSILGTQAYLDWDMFQLLGRGRAPQGVEWTLSTDYLSERGPGLGTTLQYDRDYFFGLTGKTRGTFDAWGIYDTGLDTLGRDRRNLEPEQDFRGHITARHRQLLAYDYELIAEVGYLSDRNFLEQYFESDWDQGKDRDTGLRLRKHYFNQQFELSAEARLNSFYSETQRLPRLEHYLLGGSLLGDRLTWSMKNQVGYADMNIADLPKDPAQAAITYNPLPGEYEAKGVIASTRQEIAMPLELGPIKFVPFLSGEASHYGEDINGEDLNRLIGQAGIRSSMPMWKVDHNVSSSLLNVNGLAHKAEWVGEYFYADSNTDYDQLPLYDRLDDNAQEEFRRRFIYSNYGGVLPDRYDPRTYALRHGMQRSVTNPSEVIADDMMQARLGLHQRWQTKRGLPGRERIVDLMRFDFDTMLFPNDTRDNFGEVIGPTTYDFRYHIGDRVTLLSDGYFDFFDEGLRSVSAGVRSSRPGLGEVYVGVLSLEGPISSQVLRTSYDYRMNEKWIVSAINTYDFGNAGNIGQNIALTRIGESFLIRMGLDIDRGRDNVGVSFMLEPRFFPSKRVGMIGGQLIPAAGLEGLE